jgi:hypothetical protein
MDPKLPPREQEQTIRARKEQLFEEDEAFIEPLDAQEPHRLRRSFEVILRETPAAPLSSATKGLLWFAGVVVAGMLVATVVVGSQERAPAKRPGQNQTAPSVKKKTKGKSTKGRTKRAAPAASGSATVGKGT